MNSGSSASSLTLSHLVCRRAAQMSQHAMLCSRFGRGNLGASQSAGSSPEEAGARQRRSSSPQRLAHPSGGVAPLRLRPARASESSPAEIQPIASSSSAIPDEEDARKVSILASIQHLPTVRLSNSLCKTGGVGCEGRVCICWPKHVTELCSA